MPYNTADRPMVVARMQHLPLFDLHNKTAFVDTHEGRFA